MRQGVQQAGSFSEIAERAEVKQEQAPAGTVTRELAPGRIPQTPALTSGLPVRRSIVIRAEKKRSKRASAEETPGRRLSPRLRQAIVLVTTLLVLVGTLATLIPLASDQHTWNLPSSLGALIQSARNDLQSLVAQQGSQPSTGTKTLPPMTIPRSQLVTLAEQDATDAGISPTYFVRQINLESGFNPNAVSPGGAEGIAQFEPATAAGLGIDPFNPTQALKAAAQMMARYSNQYGGYDKALAAYNAGPATLQRAENSCGANWLSCMPPETQHYVSTIIGS